MSRKTGQKAVSELDSGGGFTRLLSLKYWERETIMIRSELVQKVAKENKALTPHEVERIVDTVFDEITAAMARGDRVELRGFGTFSAKKREARMGRNPRSGEPVHIPEKFVPFFKAGKRLRDLMNQE